MNTKRFICVIAITVCLYTKSVFAETSVINNEKEDEYIPYLNERYDEFDWNLLKEFESQPKTEDNILFSPFSLKIVLAMLYEATAGQTETDLRKVLNFPISRHATRERMQQIIKSLNEFSNNQTLYLGTGIFLDSKLKPDMQFAHNLKRHYEAFINSVDFNKNVETADYINSWVRNITKNHIKQLVRSEDIQDALLVLTNALYFKGLWKHPFDGNYTKQGLFHTSEKKSVLVDYMSNYNTYFYSNCTQYDVQFLRIPFWGKISMFIILPHTSTSLSKVISNLSPKKLQDLRWCLVKEEVDVRIPKFSIEYTSSLKEKLSNMGLSKIFKDIAHLPGIIKKNNNETTKHVQVSNVVQKAGMEISEEGAEAWVATETTLVNKFGGQKLFNASRPFLFYLEDEQSGNIIFMGKVIDPTKYEQINPIEDVFGKNKNITL